MQQHGVANACDETQLPCSPSELPSTDVALATIKELDLHEEMVQAEAIVG